MTGTDRHWYVVMTQPHAELKAVSHLERQGFEVYLPRFLKRRRHARRTEIVAAPLFPRYAFVGVDVTAQRWRAIHSTVGVARLVGSGDTPVRVGREIVDSLKRMQDDAGYVSLPQRPAFRPGDAVRVVEGAFASCLGLVDGLSDGERVAILLDMLGRKVRVLVGIDAISAA